MNKCYLESVAGSIQMTVPASDDSLLATLIQLMSSSGGYFRPEQLNIKDFVAAEVDLNLGWRLHQAETVVDQLEMAKNQGSMQYHRNALELL